MERLFRRAALLLLMAAACSAENKPFSHKFHLAMKLACESCHAGAGASARAADNLMPAQQACARCHEREMTVAAPRKSIVTKFNHQLHGKLGNAAGLIAAAIDAKQYHHSPAGTLPGADERARFNTANACAACHRGIEESVKIDGTSFPVMQDCLVCHPKIDAPFSCEKCHDAGNHLKPASHDGHYIDFHSTGKANLNKQSCVVCHSRKFSCLGCH